MAAWHGGSPEPLATSTGLETSPPSPAGMSTPCLEELNGGAGYEGVTFDGAYVTPPKQEATEQAQGDTNFVQHSVPNVTEEDVRESLMAFVNSNCCYGSGPAKNMKINDLVSENATHYVLETFTEKRSTVWTHEPFQGQIIEGAGNAPAPWDIEISSPKGLFQDATLSVEVPNTAQVRICHRCIGIGRIRCEVCSGHGEMVCYRCNGTGTVRDPNRNIRSCCSSCGGTGSESCSSCTGNGQVRCKACCGHCQLKYFIKLTAVWTNHIGNNVSDTGQFPRELIVNAQGKTVFETQMPRVSPVTHFSGNFVKLASTGLIAKHGSSFSDERILHQRQSVRMVPVVQVIYTWKQQDGSFYVYGLDNQVHFPGYPQTCCCGCQIL